MEALLYSPLENNGVRCALCAHRCKIEVGARGLCQVRENRDGRLVSLVYGKLIAQHVDPIEKKPLYHMLPGSLAYSIATVGCNFKCRFCQNADIAQMPSDHQGAVVGTAVTPDSVVADAIAKGCASIAYTYTEPTIFFEFALDVARLAREAGLRNIFVTNGYMTGEALAMLLPVLDAANVDLKSFSDDFYQQTCGARLAPVKKTLRRMKDGGVLVEVTTLLIPGHNDAPEELETLARFLAEELGPETPWHISRFHPTYRMTDRAQTPVETLEMARKIGLAAGLRYVYIGNVPGSGGENTICPDCRNIVINRFQYRSRTNLIDSNHCASCHHIIDGVFD
jgi:pyruvate formate lyase activating enzyme